ncbi:DCN1-like protein 4/5 [Dioscorea alata]|uniref:DCN1-like protein 4/5 n=1 Tax=Dioscorea alata TaxID=55571 RepID=A0ACB7VLM4_DIOAL|nr:DCN1-like protein 4/5 [Dioscorea alata]
MKRSSSRRSGVSSSSSSPGSCDLLRSGSSKAVSKETERIDQLFYTYMDKPSGMIDPEGIESFCSDLEVDHTDVRILMLAWKMQAERQGYFTLEEWRKGLKALHADSISKIKKVLPDLEREVRRPTSFMDFYSYSFRYCLTEEKQKSIDIESACELLSVVLGYLFRHQVDKLVEYLKNQHEYKVINMDQWMSFLRFCNEINFPSLENYDPNLAWPLILDNFVDWMREKQNGSLGLKSF